MYSASEQALKSRLTSRAQELGFDLCRVTHASKPESSQHFQQWLEAGHHGQMGYLERAQQKRIEPSLVLTHIQSVITLAVSYFRDNDTHAKTSLPSARGVVARFARYEDYHDILGEKLTELTRVLKEEARPPFDSLWYVDTGPILERDLAQRAGLGFIGKHTNLINRNLGNWFFISEILTTAKLPPDEPEKNRCGTCHRCIDACPTQALPKPFVLDARRCISYLTIELKGTIPESLRPLIGNRIFGCDDCLEACPWNRFARKGNLMSSFHRQATENVDLEQWAHLEPDEFKRQFRGTPFFRTKWKRLIRNVCVALGNVGTQENLPTLRRLSEHSEPLIAEHATWAVQEILKRAQPDALQDSSPSQSQP